MCFSADIWCRTETVGLGQRGSSVGIKSDGDQDHLAIKTGFLRGLNGSRQTKKASTGSARKCQRRAYSSGSDGSSYDASNTMMPRCLRLCLKPPVVFHHRGQALVPLWSMHPQCHRGHTYRFVSPLIVLTPKEVPLDYSGRVLSRPLCPPSSKSAQFVSIDSVTRWLLLAVRRGPTLSRSSAFSLTVKPCL